MTICTLKEAKIPCQRDFPGGSGLKTVSSNAGDVGSVLGWGDKIPHALRPKKTKQKTEKTTVTKHSTVKQNYCNKKKIKKKSLITETNSPASLFPTIAISTTQNTRENLDEA